MFPSVARVGDLSRWFSSTATDLYRGGSPQIEREAVVVFFDSALSLIMHLLVLIGCFSMLSVGSRRICVSVGLVDGDRAFPRCLSSNRKVNRFFCCFITHVLDYLFVSVFVVFSSNLCLVNRFFCCLFPVICWFSSNLCLFCFGVCCKIDVLSLI